MSKLDKVLVAKLAFLSDMYHTVYMLARGRFPFWFSRPAPRPPRPSEVAAVVVVPRAARVPAGHPARTFLIKPYVHSSQQTANIS